ncbi:hypothetical protein ABFS83_06G196400 [Erythranthe nasuta]
MIQHLPPQCTNSINQKNSKKKKKREIRYLTRTDMAEAAVLSAVKILSELVIRNAGYLHGVEDQVNWLKGELEMMQCFLKDAAEKQSENESIGKWISDIRELAHDADDVIESFILKFDASRSNFGAFGKLIHLPSNLYHLSIVGNEINSIKGKLEEIERSRVRYGIQNLCEMRAESSRSLEDAGEVERRRRLSPWQKDKHVVGLERDVQLLLDKAILDGSGGLTVATIVGMGGIGKSTLAKKVYNHSGVAKRFDVCAWVVVSNEFKPKDIVKELMPQILGTRENKLAVLETMEKLSVASVEEMLHERLRGKRYFVVLDDLWDNKHWESLASVFPDEGRGSRLLITSRNQDIVKHARYVHKIKLLDSGESWELLKKTAFIDSGNEYKCPQDLKSIGEKILKKCDGLPLAITVVGGLLVDKTPSKGKWEKVLEEINSHLGTKESKVSKILDLSYRNLSPELKACFLSLSLFKEDATIRARKLVQVWVAQGLIKQEKGESYLDELINRNMVRVKDMSKNETVKSCQIHDLIRELSIIKAKEEASFEILREDSKARLSLHKPRNRAIYCSSETFIHSIDKNKHLRSLFFHADGDKKFDLEPSYWKSFELLRILDFEDFKLEVVPDTISELTGLRYLGLRNTMIRNLPRSLGRLKKLEVLDIARTRHSLQVPDVIWEMDSLSHLYMHHHFICDAPLRLDTLKNLHSLSYIKMDYLILEHLTQIASLRKLGISLFSTKKVEWSSPLKSLVRVTQLKVVGMLTKVPSAAYFPPNITCLTLVRTTIEEDPMPVLEKLPKLVCLKFKMYAYCGQEMVISSKGFPKLQVLILHTMDNLKNIRLLGLRGGIMPLKRLEIYKCPCLNQLPEKLRSMATIVNK